MRRQLHEKEENYDKFEEKFVVLRYELDKSTNLLKFRKVLKF